MPSYGGAPSARQEAMGASWDRRQEEARSPVPASLESYDKRAFPTKRMCDVVELMDDKIITAQWQVRTRFEKPRPAKHSFSPCTSPLCNQAPETQLVVVDRMPPVLKLIFQHGSEQGGQYSETNPYGDISFKYITAAGSEASVSHRCEDGILR